MKWMLLTLIVATSAPSAAFAGSPFDGIWKSDPAKRQGDVTFSFHDRGDGALEYSDPTESYTVKLDGAPVTTPLGEEVAMRQTGERSYAFTTRRGGKLLTDEHWKLSPDGKTLTIDWRSFQPDGKTYHSEEVDSRLSPGAGVVGTWKIMKLTSDLKAALLIRTTGRDGVTFEAVVARSVVHARWDGRDYPASGPLVPPGVTVALMQMGPREFKQVTKVRGKLMATSTYRLAADGKSMVSRTVDADGKSVQTQLLERQ